MTTADIRTEALKTLGQSRCEQIVAEMAHAPGTRAQRRAAILDILEIECDAVYDRNGVINPKEWQEARAMAAPVEAAIDATGATRLGQLQFITHDFGFKVFANVMQKGDFIMRTLSAVADTEQEACNRLIAKLA